MKSQNILNSLLSLTLLIATGCSGFNQDPLADREARFQNPSPKPAPSEPSKPLPSDAIRIVAPDFVSFQEGRRQEISIRGRALLEGYSVNLTIDNLSELSGASYNPATETLIWTPPRDWVDKKSSGGVFAEMPLTIHAEAQKSGSPVLITTRQILLRVSREFKNPEIIRIETSENFVREGEYVSWFKVHVRDPDAEFNDVSTWPRLTFDALGSGGAKNLSGFVKTSGVQRMGGGEYRFSLLIDLRDAELTRSVDTYGFILTAVSQFGKASMEHNYSVQVFNRYSPPVSSWTEEATMKTGQTNTFNFVVLDPKQEGVLNLERVTDLPTGAQLNCRHASGNRSLLNCTMTFAPTENEIGSRSLTLHVQTASPDARDSSRTVHSLQGRFHVISGGN